MAEMDAKAIEMLSKGLQACKRKCTASGEPIAKKASVNTPSSATPVDAAATSKVTTGAEVVSTIGASIVVGAPEPSMPPSSSTKIPPIDGEKRKENRKMKMSTTVKVRHKAHLSKPSGHSDDLEENPFNNQDLVRDLVDKFALLEVVDWIASLD